MKTKTVIIIIVVALGAILVVQNSGTGILRIYFWNIYAPQFILALALFCLGFLAGFLAARTRGRARDVKPEPRPPEPPQMPPAQKP
jgi:uncharacterized integral membrane protein